ncbi:hypothetical protein EVAR_39978_1 [Eumeta japonica]|uniref:Uncharacterized protein n=1 Tax=Eumeta variegata TaxID=151549 RepID=A0A4C1YJS0_EUMVA|nr:hypothetical protein EVAR_39978_1 [Eumeta japonica]
MYKTRFTVEPKVKEKGGTEIEIRNRAGFRTSVVAICAPTNVSVTVLWSFDQFILVPADPPASLGSGGATPLVDVGDIRREAVGGRRRRRRLAPPLSIGYLESGYHKNVKSKSVKTNEAHE